MFQRLASLPRATFAQHFQARFLVGLLAGFVLVPLVPGTILALLTQSPKGDPSYWPSMILIYGLFGFAAMVVLGTPLLLLFLWLGWTGFVPFIAAGGLCASLTAAAMLPWQHNRDVIVFFAGTGLAAGALFRLILFGSPSTPRR